MRNGFRIVLLLLCLTSPRFALGDASCGPLPWAPPTEAPKLRCTLSAKDYADQINAQLKQSDPSQVTDQMPWTGLLVSVVGPKSQAKKLGITPGYVLVKSNDVQIFSADDWERHRNANDTTSTVWSPATGNRVVNLQPGLIGVALKPYLRPEVLYLRELAAGTKADPVLFAAAACAQETPELSRAAAAHAREDGDADEFVYFVDAIAASEEGNFDDAIASGMWAMHAGSDAQKQVLAPLMRSAALAGFHLGLAAQMEKDYPSLKLTDQIDDETGKDYTVDLLKTIDQCNAITWNGPSSCADTFAALKPVDHTADMVNAGKRSDFGKQAAESIKTSSHVLFNAPADHYQLDVLGPAGSNVRFSLHCRFSPNKITFKANAGQAVKFGVCFKGSKEMPISLSLDPDGGVEIVGSDVPGFDYRLADTYTTGQIFDVALIIVGNRCEIDIAGVRAFYGPILADPATRKLCFVFDAIGVKGQINHVNWETAPAKN
jgi:hypothetical protein